MATSNDDRPSRRMALGKGLGALIPKPSATAEKREYIQLATDRINAASIQPRTNFDQDRLQELAESIQSSGLIQPLVVREVNGRYELIAGERRLRACRLAGIGNVPVVIKDVTDAEAYALAIVENIQREDLNPLEEAFAFQKLLEDFGLTQSELASQLGKSRAAVANAVRLLNLPQSVQDLVVGGELSAGHARAMAALTHEQARELAEHVLAQGWSVRETEQLAQELKEGFRLTETFEEKEELAGGAAKDVPEEQPKPERQSRYRDDPQIRHITQRLQQTLGTRVKIKDTRGKGRLEIFYDDYEILNGILDALGVVEKDQD